MSEIQIQSTISISQETINEIAYRIFVRLLALSKQSEPNLETEEKTEDFSLNQEESEEAPEQTTKKVIPPHRRKHFKMLEIGGASMSFKNAISIFKTFNIEIREYDYVFNNLNFRNHEHDIVHVEAERVKKTLGEHGYNVDSYSAYDFNGKLITVKF